MSGTSPPFLDLKELKENFESQEKQEHLDISFDEIEVIIGKDFVGHFGP